MSSSPGILRTGSALAMAERSAYANLRLMARAVTTVEWMGFPLRAARRRTRRAAEALLDQPQGREHQDEYPRSGAPCATQAGACAVSS